MRPNLVLFAALVVACAACTRPAAVPEAPLDTSPATAPLTSEGAPIALRRSLVADEYFWLRAKTRDGDAPPPFAAALAAMQDLRAALGGDASAWEDLEVPLGSALSASELVGIYGALPERTNVEGRTVALRESALRVARALEATERAFRGGPYREHEDDIARAAKDLGVTVVPHEGEIVRAIEEDMALPGMEQPIVVTLVSDAPYPSIFAADATGKTVASFLRVHGLEGSALAESVIGHALHAIDEITVKAPTAMNTLRGALARRGHDDGDPNVEMAINVVTFAEGASLVRRFVDPNHVPLGESGFYASFPAAPAIVEAWSRHLQGEGLEDTAEAVAQAISAP